ncbi:MAG: beta strand repeat-containing protein [Phycisphaerae bacterium]
MTFGGAAGAKNPLASLIVSSPAIISGGTVTTTNGQTYNGTLMLNAANITLTDSGVAGITLNSVGATSSDNLAISQTGTGTVSLDGSIATLNNFSIATAGTIILRGSITTNDLSISSSSTGGGNPLSVPVAVTINADTQSYAATGTGDTLGSLANLLLANTAGTAAPRSISLTQDATIEDTGLPALTQFTTGVLTGSSYSITSLSGNITLAGGSSTPVSDANLILSAPHGNISLGAPGVFTISSLTATSATTGAITLEGNVTTTNGQTYNSAVTLGVGATLTTTNSAVTFASTVDSASSIAEALTVNAGTGTVTFGGAVGAVNPLASLTVDSPTIINGGAVTTTNGQIYHGSVTLGANTTLTDPTFIDVINTVNGSGFSLTLADSGGASTLGSAVTTNSLNITAGTIALNGGTVTTSNGQKYIGAVTLGANTTLTDPTSINFANAVSGAGSSLTLADSSGTSTFSGTITTSALHVTAGTIALNGGAVTTSNGENFNGAVTLGANTTLTDPLSIAFLNTVSGPGFFLTLADSGGASTLAGALNTNSLNITAAAIDLNGATVTTASNQSYNGVVALGSDTTLTTTNNGAVNFSSTVNAATAGGQFLAVDTGSGTATFGGAVGGTHSLASLTVSGPSIINGGAVTTTGGQSYIGSVALGANTAIATTNNGVIRFSSSVDALTAGAEGLTLNAGAGAVTFGGAVGGLNSLAALTVSGPTVINGGEVTTTGAQIYDNAVALGADSILATANSAVNFASTVDSASPTAETLTINAGTGTVTFGGAVGQSHALANLTVTGLTQINGGTVTTNGGQSYNSTVALGANTVLTGSTLNSSTTPAVFSGSGDILTLAFSGNVNLGVISTLGSLVSSGLGATTLYGDITTSGAQSYNGTIALAATPITLTGTTLNSLSTPAVFSGSGGALTLAFSGNADLGAITALGSLADTGSGTTTLYGDITTSGVQSYNGTVSLGAAAITLTGTTLNSSSTPAVFSGSGDTLTLDFSGNTNLGAISTLGSLVSSGLGATTLYGNISTSGAQSYNGTIALAATPITLTGTTLNSLSTPAVFSGSGGALTLAFSGNADLGAITALGSLADTGSGTTTLYGDITTSGVQSYNGTVSLGAAAITLTGTTLNSSSTPAVFSGSGDTLTLNFSGNASLGTISTLGSLANTGLGATTLYGNITTSGFQSYNGTVSLAAGAITLTGTTLNSSSAPAVLSGSGGALILAFSGTADLGTITALNSLADTGSGTTTLYGNITTSGNQIYSSSTGIASALTLTGTSLNPSPNAAAIFSGASAPALTLDFSRSYNVNLGASSGLASLDLGVPSTAPFNILTSTTLSYPLTVAGTVTVGQSSDPAGSVITLTGPAFTFKSSFDAASPNDAVIFAALGGTASSVEFDGVVGGSSANPDLASLTVQGTATINGGAVNTVNSQIYNGSVTINGGGTTTFTSTQGGIAENGGISDTAGSITLSPDSALMVPNPDPILGAGATTGDFRPQNYLTLNGNITAFGTVTLAPNAPSFNNVNNPVPDAATIITTAQSGTVTMAGTNIYMGMGQKWTSLTSLTLNANAVGGANVAALGDLNVAGTLTVRANTIDMLLRPAGSQLVPGSSSGVLGLHVNTPGSEGVDIVANSLNLTGSIVPVGPVSDYAPQFAYGPGGTVTGSITPNSPGVHYYGVNVVPSTLMASGIADGRLTTYYLDLKASGPSTSNVTVAVAPILPPPPPQFNSVVVLSSEQRQILREAGINARNTSIDNILNLFGGKAVFNDIPTSDGMIIVHPTLLDYYVTTSRLPYQQTREFIAMYRDLFLAPVLDPKTHQPELDQRGNPVYRSRRMELHVLFRDSYNDYSKAVGAAHATPLGFRTWLEKTPGQAKVLSTLNQLRTLMRQVRVLGLTSVELRLSHSTILAELNPGALSERQFEETVMGHRLSKL